MSQQLTFDLPFRTAMGRDNFFVTPTLSHVLTQVDNWRSWPNSNFILLGPAQSGKTHLASVWADDVGADVIDALSLAHYDPMSLATKPLVIEDIHKLATDTEKQTALFHVYNAARQAATPLLMTGRGHPKTWNFTIADVQSRVSGCLAFSMPEPDDALLQAVMLKLFADRQIFPPAHVLSYLVLRMERSLAMVERVVAQIDRRALAQKRSITRALAAEALDAVAASD